MSLVWKTLESLTDHFTGELDANSGRIEEPGMERFNQNGWINRVWRSPHFRRAHLDVVDSRENKGLYMMHLCIFPELHSDAPIFGFDVIAGEKKMTGAFLDYSPSINPDHVMIQDFGKVVSNLEWKRERELPDWGKQIFSEHMMAAGNVKENEEVSRVAAVARSLFSHYLMSLTLNSVTKFDTEAVRASHNRYAYYQKQNPHTPRVMKSLGLDEEDVDVFVRDVLFPEI